MDDKGDLSRGSIRWGPFPLLSPLRLSGRTGVLLGGVYAHGSKSMVSTVGVNQNGMNGE